MSRQLSSDGSVENGDRQGLEVAGNERCGKVVRRLKLSQRLLDANFPRRRRADIDYVGPIADSRAGVNFKGRIIRQPPEQRVGVQQ